MKKAVLLIMATAMVCAGISARAGTITATKVDGVNFQYTAVDTNGVLTVNFTNPFNFVTQINNTLIPQLPAEFATLTLGATTLTDDIPGLSGHFAPNLNSTKYGITSLSPPGAPNVVFDYSISFGQALANGLTLTGTVALDPASATTLMANGSTYDFSPFQTFSSFTLSLGTQDQTGTLLYDVLKAGNGTFSGTGQFDQTAPTPPSVPDTGATVVLLGIGVVLTIVAQRVTRPNSRGC